MNDTNLTPSNKSTYFLLFLIFCITSLLYYNGLNGPFLLDDISNLSTLANVGLSFESMSGFILGNESGPLGRPVSMATFLINLDNWPDKPYFFKLFNLILHLTNGLLIYNFTFKLIPILTPKISKGNVFSIALFSTAIWLIHPFHVSTTLYVIQRMTQLSTLFSMLALITFLNNILLFSNATKLSQLILPASKIFLLFLLAIFSKENAVQLISALFIISLLIKSKEMGAYFNAWLWLLGLVTLIYILYIIQYSWPSPTYEIKGFTLWERLMSQSRVLFSYITQIILPRSWQMSLNHDDFLLSTDITTPISTLTSCIALTGIITSLFFKTHVIYKFSVAWFLNWHLIESTILPLDIYFEHRNYLPSLGPIIGLVYCVHQTWFFKRRIHKIILYFFCSLLSFQTFTLVQKWSSEEDLYYHWLVNHPSSKLTYLNLHGYYLKTGQLDVAHRLLSKTSRFKIFENDVNFLLYLYNINCLLGKESDFLLNKLNTAAKMRHPVQRLGSGGYITLVNNILSNSCKPTNLDGLHKSLNNVINHSPLRLLRHTHAAMILAHSYIYLHYGQFDQALKLTLASYKINKTDKALQKLIEINLILGDNKQALYWTQKAKQYLAKNSSSTLELFLKLKAGNSYE